MRNMDITIYQNQNSYQQPNNPFGYTKEFIILAGDTLELEKAIEFDNCPAKYIDGHRKGDNFQKSNCILADIDNTHSDNKDDWITHEDVTRALPSVAFYYYPSRNNMKIKNGKSARPKEHYIFPTNSINNVNDYVKTMKYLIESFPELHFDPNVKSPAQLNFGVKNAQVFYVKGTLNLSNYMTSNQKKQFDIIPDGQRNNTLHKSALRLLTKYGECKKALNAYMKKALLCQPPLDRGEVNSIWHNAVKYYHSEIETSANYISPNIYQQDHNLHFQLPVKNANEFNRLFNMHGNNKNFTIDIVKSFLIAFGITIRLNDMNRQIEVLGFPLRYGNDDLFNLLSTIIYDSANTLSFKKTSITIANDFLKVIANENHYHPVLELLNSKEWDGQDRLNELYRIIGITDDFHKTLVLKWAIQTVAILHNSKDNPISAQGVLVLQGDQGIGKTQFLRHLAIKEEFFKGGATLDMSNKDSLLSAIKVWICELGEIDSTTKKEQSALKGFLTEQVDHFREPYARSETISYRKTSFCGTVNPKMFLLDETGNRRFWTIPVKSIDIKSLFKYSSDWYAHFWRQIHLEYQNNPKGYLLNHEEQSKLNNRNKEFETDVYGEDEFLSKFDIYADESYWKYHSAAEIADMLNSHYKSLNINSIKVGRSLIPKIEKRIGKEFQRKTINGKRLILCPPVSNSTLRDYRVPIPKI